MKKFTIHTLGCRVNQYETQAIKEEFIEKGFEQAMDGDIADIYVVNTCTVTNIADRKSRQLINRARKDNPNAIIAAIGCYPQNSKGVIKNADIVLGTGDKSSLVDKVIAYQSNDSKAKEPQLNSMCVLNPSSVYDEMKMISSMDSRTRAYIKIEDGCDRFCTYCAIPYARGPVRSRNPEKILTEAKALLSNGYKELVLTGINTALYGYDLDSSKYGLHTIIEKLENLEGDFRIRIGSLEPTVVNASYVKKLLTYERLCPHFHLSMQSGSDNILKSMKRRYNRNDYLKIIEVLKDHNENFGISTDIIVGFPGEFDDDFEMSLSMVENIDFQHVHIFPYSRREGTEAACMANHLEKKVKTDRIQLLTEASQKSSKRFLIKNIGYVQRTLFESYEKGQLEGITENGIKVYTSGNPREVNEFKYIKLNDCYKEGMKGCVVKG